MSYPVWTEQCLSPSPDRLAERSVAGGGGHTQRPHWPRSGGDSRHRSDWRAASAASQPPKESSFLQPVSNAKVSQRSADPNRAPHICNPSSPLEAPLTLTCTAAEPPYTDSANRSRTPAALIFSRVKMLLRSQAGGVCACSVPALPLLRCCLSRGGHWAGPTGSSFWLYDHDQQMFSFFLLLIRPSLEHAQCHLINPGSCHSPTGIWHICAW